MWILPLLLHENKKDVAFILKEPYWSSSENNLHQGFPAPLAGDKSGPSNRPGTFPPLDPKAIKQFIQEEETHKETYILKPNDPEIVPSGKMYSRTPQHYVHGRKLEVLKDCVSYIFENKISEARKVSETASPT